MSAPLVFQLFEDTGLAKAFVEGRGFERGDLEIHTFPDGESLVRFLTPLKDRHLILCASLDHPNPKALPLIFASETARQLGAASITLVAPYLPYMRQDKIFQTGEGITSAYFASLLSRHVDLLITVDPHLHRWHSLDALYGIPTQVLHATSVLAPWIHTHVSAPLILGPDKESDQWVREVADLLGCPFVVLDKMRRGDFDVSVSMPDGKSFKGHTPVLVDDIISSGRTMVEALRALQSLGTLPPVCMGIHALMGEEAVKEMQDAGARQIVTCNTILHPTNGIDINSLIVENF